MRWLWVCIMACWLLPPTAARAAPGSVNLEWQRPRNSTCSPQPLLEHDVEQALGRRVFTANPNAHLHIRGTVDDRWSGVVVRLQARSNDGRLLGTRELRAEAGECAALRDDIDLVLTLLVESDAAKERAASTALRIDAGLWAGYLVNTLPRGTFGAGPSLVLNLGESIQLRSDAAYWLPVVIQSARGIRAELQAASVALRVCPNLTGGAEGFVSLRLCVGTQLGTLFAKQTEPSGPGIQARLLAQGFVELRSELHLGRTASIELALGPVVSPARVRIFSVRRDGSRALLYREPAFGLILSLGLII